MSSQISIISSMATQHLLADLAARYEEESGTKVALTCAGGVEVQKRVRADEAADVVVLAADVIDQLIEAGKLVAGSRVDLVCSGVAIAVKAGAGAGAGSGENAAGEGAGKGTGQGAGTFDVSSEEGLRQAVLKARTIGYSTGPSGVYLQKLFERWGIADAIAERTVQAKPGSPVGKLIVAGEVELGFQQLSELIHLEGIDILGPLPEAVQLMTVFSAGVSSTCRQPDAAKALMQYLASPAATPAKQANGMEAASDDAASR